MTKIKKVLVVDDDKIYHFILKNLFSKNEIAVTGCFSDNGFDGIEKLKHKIEKDILPDVILLDINMPIMDGWQFLDEYKKLKTQYHLQVPVYLISSSNNPDDYHRAKFYENDISAYLLKPINEQDICKIFLN